MSTLYWIMVLGNVCQAVDIIVILSLIATPLLTIGYIYSSTDDDIEESFAKACKASYAVLAVSLILCIFIPSKKEMYMIYGVGGTIDYLKQNPTANQLPDKCIKAIDKWVDDLAKDDKNNKEDEQ